MFYNMLLGRKWLLLAIICYILLRDRERDCHGGFASVCVVVYYVWSYHVIDGYGWLYVVICGCTWL